MAGRDIYEYIRLNGARFGVAPSPFSVEASLGQSPSGALGPTALTRMGRVGGLGNGGGKLQTATAQGRGAPAIIRPSGYAGHRQPVKAAPDQFPAATQAVNTVANVGGGFLTGLGNQVAGVYQTVTSPIETGKAALAGLRELVQNPQSGIDALKGLYDMATGSQRGFGQALGELVPIPGPSRPGPRRDIFIGKNAQTWDSVAADKAARLEKSGATPEEIWEQTGTFKAADGQWRQEISDDAAHYTPGRAYDRAWFKNSSEDFRTQLGGALRHPELFDAYPGMKSATFTVQDPPLGGRPRGWFDPTTGEMGLRPDLGMRTSTGRDVLLHEVQHAVQNIEGFGQGGNKLMAFRSPEGTALLQEARRVLTTPRDIKAYAWEAWGSKEVTPEIEAAYKAYAKDAGKMDAGKDLLAQELAADLYYKRLAGEAEARAVQARKDLTARQRQERYPGQDYDVPLNLQIVRK